MSGIHGSAYAAFPGMVSSWVQRSVAKPAIWPTVFAAGALLADGEQQAVAQGDSEVFVRHGHDTVDRGKKEGAGPSTAMRPDIGRVGVA